MIKPYEKYKDSGVEWLGYVPEKWEVLPFKRLALIANGKDQKDVMIDEGGFPVYGTGGEFGRASEYIYDKPSVLLGRKGTIDKPQFVDEPFWAVDTIFYTEIKDQVNPKFLFYLTSKIPFDYLQESSAVPSMTQTKLNNVYLCKPPLSEQTQIANYLDYQTGIIDELIAKKEKLVELLKEKRQATINNAVTKGLDPNAKMKDSGIEWLGKVPEGWKVVKIKNCSKKVHTGKTPPTDNDEYFSDGVIDWFSPGDFQSLYLAHSQRKISHKAVLELGLELYPANTILLVGIGATLGKVGIVSQVCFSNQQVNAIVFKENVNPLFALFYLHSIKEIIIKDANASTLSILNQFQTKNLSMLLPPIEIQNSIVEFINNFYFKAEQLLKEMYKQIENLKSYRQSIISEAVTGKIDLREWKRPVNDNI